MSIDWYKYYDHENYPDYQTEEIVIQALKDCPHVNVIKYINVDITPDIQRELSRIKLLELTVGEKSGINSSIHDMPLFYVTITNKTREYNKKDISEQEKQKFIDYLGIIKSKK